MLDVADDFTDRHLLNPPDPLALLPLAFFLGLQLLQRLFQTIQLLTPDLLDVLDLTVGAVDFLGEEAFEFETCFVVLAHVLQHFLLVSRQLRVSSVELPHDFVQLAHVGEQELDIVLKAKARLLNPEDSVRILLRLADLLDLLINPALDLKIVQVSVEVKLVLLLPFLFLLHLDPFEPSELFLLTLMHHWLLDCCHLLVPHDESEYVVVRGLGRLLFLFDDVESGLWRAVLLDLG